MFGSKFGSMCKAAPSPFSEEMGPLYTGNQFGSSEVISFSCTSSIFHTVDRAIFHAGPTVWNALSSSLRNCRNIDSFKVQLKTYLFKKAFNL